MKLCSKCKIEQPLDNFANNKNNKDGKHGTCKTCVKEYQLTIQDKLKAYQKEYQPVYKQENYGDLIAYQQQWKAANKDKCRAYMKKSLAKPEVAAKKRAYMREYNKLWRENNPEKWRESVKKYNEKMKLKRQNEQ